MKFYNNSAHNAVPLPAYHSSHLPSHITGMSEPDIVGQLIVKSGDHADKKTAAVVRQRHSFCVSFFSPTTVEPGGNFRQ